MMSGGYYMPGGGLLMLLVWSALIVVPFYQLWKRTGHSGWLSLLMLVPVVNLIALYVLAFKNWPALPDAPNTRDRGGA